jgi:hypothetical protein
MRVCQFRHFGTVKAGALNATLTCPVMPFPLGLQMNCNTRPRHVESAPAQDLAPRPGVENPCCSQHFPAGFCEKPPSRAIFLLFASERWSCSSAKGS